MSNPDYSATYVVLETDDAKGLRGYGLTFTNGRGNEVCVAAVARCSIMCSVERLSR